MCYDRANAQHVLCVSAESGQGFNTFDVMGEKDGKRLCDAYNYRARLCVVCRQNRRSGKEDKKVKKVVRQLAGIQRKLYKIVSPEPQEWIKENQIGILKMPTKNRRLNYKYIVGKKLSSNRNYTVDDIVAILGIAKSTAYRLVNSGESKAIRISYGIDPHFPEVV